MDTSQWAAPLHKRIACDRCHDRKLRCLREISTSKCSRCIQDGCVCTYSPPLKSGRPKKARPTVPGDHFDLDGTARLHDAADQSRTPLSSKSTSGHCPTSSNVGEVTSPPSFLSDMLCNSEVENAGDSMDMSDVNSFFDTGSAAMDFSNEIPSSSATSDNTLWSDLLQANAQSSHSTDLPTYPSNPLHILGGLKTPPADDDTGRNILWTSADEGMHPNISRQCNILSQIASSHLDIHTHKRDVDNSNKCRSELLQKLSQLQQGLVQSTKADTFNDVVPPSTGHPSACKNGKDYSSRKHPVNAILKPGQELIDIIRDLLAKCEEKEPDQADHCFDHGTLVLSVITPLCLLLSTYERLLKEISSALHPWSSHYDSNGSRTAGSNREPHFSDAHHQTTQQNTLFHQSRRINSPDSHPGPYPTLLADNLSMKLGEMSLDQQTQLVVVVTVINRHLIYLESALHQYQSRRMDGRVTKDISERLFTTLMSELRASIKLLKSEARDLL